MFWKYFSIAMADEIYIPESSAPPTVARLRQASVSGTWGRSPALTINGQ
jgi:hypothetical protein